MNKLKSALSAVVDAANRPKEGWRMLRQAVRELHVVLQGITTLVGEFEERLDRLESAAKQRPATSSTPTASRARAPARKKAAAAGARRKRPARS